MVCVKNIIQYLSIKKKKKKTVLKLRVSRVIYSYVTYYEMFVWRVQYWSSATLTAYDVRGQLCSTAALKVKVSTLRVQHQSVCSGITWSHGGITLF